MDVSLAMQWKFETYQNATVWMFFTPGSIDFIDARIESQETGCSFYVERWFSMQVKSFLKKASDVVVA